MLDVNGTVSFNLTGKVTGANNKLRFRYYSADGLAHWDWYAYIDDVAITGPPPPVVVDTPTLLCDAVGGSMVAGFVTDANTTTGISGAKVVRDLGGLATTMPATGGLPAGFYYMFSASTVAPTQPYGPSTRTFTASKDGYGDVVRSVNLTPDTVNRLDFALPAASLSLGDWPFVIDGRLTPDGLPAWDKTDMFSVLNTGGLPADLKLNVTALPMTWLRKFPAFVPAAPAVRAEISIEARLEGAGPFERQALPRPRRLAGGRPGVRCGRLSGRELRQLADASVPGTWNVIAPAATYFAGDFINGDFSKMYALNYDTSALHEVRHRHRCGDRRRSGNSGRRRVLDRPHGRPGRNPLRLPPRRARPRPSTWSTRRRATRR